MACPFFFPVRSIQEDASRIPARLPLLGWFEGECHASSLPALPAAENLTYCNSGYGRGCCPSFPAGSDEDAVRFHIAEESPDAITVQFIFEKGFWPGRHGLLGYSRAGVEFVSKDGQDSAGPLTPCVERQARIFLERFLQMPIS